MSKHCNEAVEGDDGGLVICRGCKARGTFTELPAGECPTPYKPDRVLLAESMAREQALQLLLNDRDELAASPKPDPVLCKFYDVEDWPDLVRELVVHVAQLQDAAKRNVKPWEDTFPPTLLPAYIERVNAENAAAQPQSEPNYRLLGDGDIIQEGDETLNDDTATWGKVPMGIFVGMPYNRRVMLPVRREAS